MTCIVGIEHNGKVLIGGDSQMTSGYLPRTAPKGEKVWITGEIAMGFTGTSRHLQLLRYKFEPPPITEDLPRYMATDFIEAVRQTLRDGGYLEKENEKESVDGSFLVGIRGSLFEIDVNHAANRNADGWTASGSGRVAALGALHATRHMADAKDRALIALEAAAACDIYVTAPFFFVETETA